MCRFILGAPRTEVKKRSNHPVLLAAAAAKHYRLGMGIWNELNENLRQSSKQWLDWARQHAQEIGDAGMRHIERQDLLSERKQLLQRLGELVADRFLIEGKKTLRQDSPGVGDIMERLTVIDDRLSELSVADETENDDTETDERDATPRDE